MADLGSVGIKADTDHLFYQYAFYSTAPPVDLSRTVSGIVYNDAAAPTARTVRVYSRSNGALIGEVVSDAGTGAYSITCPDAEVNRIVLDDTAGTLYNDIIDRVLPG